MIIPYLWLYCFTATSAVSSRSRRQDLSAVLGSVANAFPNGAAAAGSNSVGVTSTASSAPLSDAEKAYLKAHNIDSSTLTADAIAKMRSSGELASAAGITSQDFLGQQREGVVRLDSENQKMLNAIGQMEADETKISSQVGNYLRRQPLEDKTDEMSIVSLLDHRSLSQILAQSSSPGGLLEAPIVFVQAIAPSLADRLINLIKVEALKEISGLQKTSSVAAKGGATPRVDLQQILEQYPDQDSIEDRIEEVTDELDEEEERIEELKKSAPDLKGTGAAQQAVTDLREATLKAQDLNHELSLLKEAKKRAPT